MRITSVGHAAFAAVMIAFGILGILGTWALQWLERVMCPWKRA